MASFCQIFFAVLIAFCIINSAFCRPTYSAEREVLEAEIKHESHKLRMLRELLNELEDTNPAAAQVKSRSRRHRTLSHKDDCYFHPVTC